MIKKKLCWKRSNYYYVVMAFTHNSLSLKPWQPPVVSLCPYMGHTHHITSQHSTLQPCPMRLTDQYQTDMQYHYLLQEQMWHYGMASPWRQGLPGIPCLLLIRDVIYSRQAMRVMDDDFKRYMIIIWAGVICVFAFQMISLRILAHQ